MIKLDTTTRSLEIDLNAVVTTNQLPFVASYTDISQSTFAVTAASTNTGASNSTTAVTLVAAPGASTTRQLQYLSIRNADTVATLLWVQVNDNTTLRELWKGTLQVGDTLVYTDSLGFNVIDANGGIKSSLVNTLATLTLTSTLTLSGTAANIATGSNFISYGGTDAGLSFDASNNATLSGALTVTGGAVTAGGNGTNAFGGSANGASNDLQIKNTSNTASSNARLIVNTGGTSGGSALAIFHNGSDFWSIGRTSAATPKLLFAPSPDLSGPELELSSTAGANRIPNGIRIGADSTDNLIDDASNGAGTATLYIGNASINVTSDERVKSGIAPLQDGLGIVRALLPIEFDQDEERPFGDVRHYMGFGARHSHKVAPWAVHTQGDTGLPWKMRQEFLMAPAIRAIQQLDERLAALEARQ